MEFAQAEVWGKSNPAKDQRECLGPSNYPNHRKCSNIYWKDSASPKELIDTEFHEQLSKSQSVSSLGKEISSSQRCLHLSFYLLFFIVWTLCIFVFIKEFSFTFKFWFCFTLSLILRPTRETQRTLLDFAKFSVRVKHTRDHTRWESFAFSFKLFSFYVPLKGNIRVLLDFAEFRFASSIREIILGESPLQIF